MRRHFLTWWQLLQNYLSVSDTSMELACKSLPVWTVDVLLFPLPFPETDFLSEEDAIPRIDLGVVFDLGVAFVATLSASSSSSEKSETELAREGIWRMACVALTNSCWRFFAATGVAELVVYSIDVSKMFYNRIDMSLWSDPTRWILYAVSRFLGL